LIVETYKRLYLRRVSAEATLFNYGITNMCYKVEICTCNWFSFIYSHSFWFIPIGEWFIPNHDSFISIHRLFIPIYQLFIPIRPFLSIFKHEGSCV